MTAAFDDHFMKMALREAEKAAADGEVPTGCVIVEPKIIEPAHDGHDPVFDWDPSVATILGRAHNQSEGLTDATAHAEMLAMSAAFAAKGNWRLVNARLYVTKEPCPMCAGGIVLARPKTVIWGVSDPKRGGGTVFNIFAHPGINHHPEIVTGVLENPCKTVLQEFFNTRRQSRPFPVLLLSSAERIRRFMKTILMFSMIVSCFSAAAMDIDKVLPAGNIEVLGVKWDKVTLRQEQRGTVGEKWFYWAFRVRGAEGRTVVFDFPDKQPGGGPVGVRGPVVSKDRGRTFAYPLDGKATKSSFVYTFGPDEHETWFYECHPYVQADWDAFVARHAEAKGKLFTVQTLCRSRNGAAVPYARFAAVKAPRIRMMMTARHHCSETMPSFVLEGVMEAFLAEDELGKWMRENVELAVVPFVDYDGVQAGDQGKARAPHDHNRDYTEFLYPETKAIAALFKEGEWSVYFDVHGPWIRGGCNEYVHTPWKSAELTPDAAMEHKFSDTLEKVQRAGMRYRASDDIPFGTGWNTAANYRQGLSSIMWAAKNVPSLRLNRSIEIPFANCRGAVVTPERCRAFGHDLAAALFAVNASGL